MLCCGNCFESPTLKEHIRTDGRTGSCDFCSSKRVKCLEVSILDDLFSPVFGLYHEIKYGSDFFEDEDPTDVGELLPDLIEEDWHPVFSERFDHNKRDSFWRELLRRPYYEHYDKDNPPICMPSLWVRDELSDHHPAMTWDDLAEHLRRERRHIIGKSELLESLRMLPEILQRSIMIIPARQRFMRARNGCLVSMAVKYRKRIPFRKKNMGPPPPEKALAGRANPTGIPFLYLATDADTAIAEVRPWKGAYVSVASFQTIRKVAVVDLSAKYIINDPFSYADSYTLSFAIEDNALLSKLGEELATPVDPERSLIDYVPSQFLTEFIRNEGYQGIMYPSAMAAGKNIVLFDEKVVTCKSVRLYRVYDVQYTNSRSS